MLFKQESNMIQLTRLNNHPLVVNSDLIKFVEQAPDTVLTLLSGEKIVVLESARDVLERVVQFRRSVLQEPMLRPEIGSALTPTVAENVVHPDARNDSGNDTGNSLGNHCPAGGK